MKVLYDCKVRKEEAREQMSLRAGALIGCVYTQHRRLRMLTLGFLMSNACLKSILSWRDESPAWVSCSGRECSVLKMTL